MATVDLTKPVSEEHDAKFSPPVNAAIVVFVLGATVTGIMSTFAGEDLAKHHREVFAAHTEELVEALETQIEGGEFAVRGLQGLFHATDEVTRDTFADYVAPIQESGDLGTLSFVAAIRVREREALEEEVRTDTSLNGIGYPSFAVHPETSHPDSFVPVFIEPLDSTSQAFGFDLGTNPKRRLAIEKARDTGMVVATEGIELLGNSPPRVGFLLMAPVYDDPQPRTLTERHRQFEGVVQGVFEIEEMISSIDLVGVDLEVAILDQPDSLASGLGPHLYSSSEELLRLSGGSNEVMETALEFGGRTWTVRTAPGEGFMAGDSSDTLPAFIIFAGALLTLALAFAAYTVFDSRDQAAQAAAEATAGMRAQTDRLREARDRAQESDRLKTTFLANMSHELRTPLNAVIGLSSVLLNRTFGELSPKQEDYLQRISTSGDHLLELIDDMLDLARIEAGREYLDLEDVCVVTVVDEAVAMLRPEAENKSIELTRTDAPDELMVQADRRRLRQVVINLLTNALKFTPEGGKVRIDVSRGPATAHIAVRDTGIGIPSRHQDTIFKPFHQVDSTLNRSRGGSGLGLALTKRLVSMHGGQINLESTEGLGSTFTVSLPAGVRNLRSRLESSDSTSGLRDRSLRGLRVLVAEDSQVNRMLMVDLLELSGCEVLEAEDGAEAVELARTERPDLIVLDIQLPVMDGVMVAEIIRNDEMLSGVPILAATAQAMPHEVDRIRSAGIDGYLAKPFTQDQFLTSVRRIVKERTAV